MLSLLYVLIAADPADFSTISKYVNLLTQTTSRRRAMPNFNGVRKIEWRELVDLFQRNS